MAKRGLRQISGADEKIYGGSERKDKRIIKEPQANSKEIKNS